LGSFRKAQEADEVQALPHDSHAGRWPEWIVKFERPVGGAVMRTRRSAKPLIGHIEIFASLTVAWLQLFVKKRRMP
jgi:hypothetical protein